MKVNLKLKKRHPRGEMRHGRHVVTGIFKEFDLNKEELESLKSVGPSFWIESSSVEKEVKPKRKR